jgi:hypothetical protein
VSRQILSDRPVHEGNAIAGHYTPLCPSWKQGFDFINSFRDSIYMRDRKYAVVSSFLYNRYFQEPEKYPDEVGFYTQLFSRPLVLDMKPNPMPDFFSSFFDFRNLTHARSYFEYYRAHRSELSSGPEIRVYQLDSAGVWEHS